MSAAAGSAPPAAARSPMPPVHRALPAEWLILISFLALIAIGTLLLSLPPATVQGEISIVDALFTATSAACVTGLTVLDTGRDFTLFGQSIILLLIQIGGLGIITLSSFFAILMGKRMPMRNRDIVRRTHNTLDGKSFLALVRRIILFTLAFEGLGAAVLLVFWAEDFSRGEAIYQSVFHSVSAFCNAGFSLFPTSLIPYQANYGVSLTIMGLVFVGGIGFFVIYDVERAILLKGQLSLHSRLALVTSIILIVAGAAAFLLLESGNTLNGMRPADRVLVSFFQAVSPRTAGFNTIDFGGLTTSALLLIIILMFIGGSPGSTAGGIKTTTFIVLMAMGYNRAQGRHSTNIFRRTIPEKSLNESFAIVLISVAILVLFNFTLQWSEAGSIPYRSAESSFIELTFEAVSAFGTVGLSTGVTPHLTFAGKLQLILLMLIGRIGPLSVAVLISRRQRVAVQYEYYKENVMVG